MSTGPLSSRLSPRPLQKCIDVKLIREWVPEPARRTINLSDAWEIIRDNYCAALTSRGVCPADCAVCHDEIVDLFRLNDAKKPAALLTWLAKDHSARMIERLIKKQKEADFPAPESDLSPQELYTSLFHRNDIDPLEELRKFYE